MRDLHRQIESYIEAAELRMHMPGHKGKKVFASSVFPYEYDVTELEQTDDLHRPEHVLKRLKERAEVLWQAENAYLLTNGSSAGNLIAIHTAYQASKFLRNFNEHNTPVSSDENIVLISRNSHISVVNALNLLEAKYVCIGNDLYDGQVVLPDCKERIKETVDKYKGKVALLILTLPTYEGLYPSDIKEIIEYAHSEKILVHIDAAHGAHLNFIDEKFNLSEAGADFFTVSLHKTLPAATSTAILFHGAKSMLDRIECKKIMDYFYDVFETSSPSYPLLLSIEDCLSYIEMNKKSMRNIYRLRRAVEEELDRLNLPYLAEHCLEANLRIDPLKLTLFEIPSDQGGVQKKLREKRIYPEYSNSFSSLLILSLQNEEETDLLIDKIQNINLELSETPKKTGEKKHDRAFYLNNSSLIEGRRYRHAVYLTMEEAQGKVIAKDLYFYPPGVPIKLAGEVFTKDDFDLLKGLDLTKLNGLKGGLVPIDESGL